MNFCIFPRLYIFSGWNHWIRLPRCNDLIALFGDGTNRYPRELKPIENSINGAIKLALPCLGNKEKVFSFKTQRQNFPTNAERFGEKIVKIF